MDVTIQADVSEFLEAAALLQDGHNHQRDLTRVLGRVVLKDSAERFQAGGPGWEPRKETEDDKAARISSAIDGSRARAVEQTRKKLWREFRRAKRKFSEDAAQNRYELVREFERRIAGGSLGYSLVSKKDDRKLAKKMGVVQERLERAAERTAGQLLGKLSGANKLRVTEDEATVENQVDWSGAQNDGEKVGHGAQLPAREFLGWSEELGEKLDVAAEAWLSRLGAD